MELSTTMNRDAKDVRDEQDVQDASWDLETLVYGKGAAGAEELMAEAERRAEELSNQRGMIAGFDGERLKSFMDELAAISDALGRADAYAGLNFSVDMRDESRGALLQKIDEQSTHIQTMLLFFDLEWAALSDEKVDELLEHPGLDLYRHHLRSERRYKDHLLSEPEEKIMTEKSITGFSAWSRLFGELTSAITVQLPEGEVPLEEALSKLASPEREVRAQTQEAVTQALGEGLKTRTFIFNTLLHDKAVNDRLRRFPSWVASRNLSNEASDESVRALVDSVQARYDIPRRWYQLKSQLLGYRLKDYDRMAPVTDDDVLVGWAEAKDIVLDGYRSFSPELAELCTQFFEDRWIDAPLRPGKRTGAFCSYTVPSHHPYIMLNWTARRRDVLTLAHELGHGVHAALARPQGIFHQSTPLTVAETASVFGETIVFGQLLEQADSAESRLSLLADKVEGAIATVFRQTAMNRFEDSVHTARRTEGELSVERFGELWTKSQRDMLGDSVEVTDNYKSWWSYVHHFIGVPGYVYAYAYGQLLALSVYSEYEKRGGDFVPAYLEMLSAGGSMPPEELAKLARIDLTDPNFWNGGLDIIDQQLSLAEAAAKEAGRI